MAASDAVDRRQPQTVGLTLRVLERAHAASPLQEQAVRRQPAALFRILMDQRTRMFKTLGCLAGAMMGTSALLGWIDPSPPLSVSLLSSEEIAGLTHSLVVDGLTIRPDRWNGIEVIGVPTTTTPAQLLTAKADDSQHHFHIDLAGRPYRTAEWSRQEGCGGQTCAVRIHVERRADGQAASRGQEGCIRALIAALNDSVAADGHPLPVRLVAR